MTGLTGWDYPAEQRDRATALTRCPTCGAPPGRRCRAVTRRGGTVTYRDYAHLARIRATLMAEGTHP